jgi:hypothetical protein
VCALVDPDETFRQVHISGYGNQICPVVTMAAGVDRSA